MIPAWVYGMRHQWRAFWRFGRLPVDDLWLGAKTGRRIRIHFALGGENASDPDGQPMLILDPTAHPDGWPNLQWQTTNGTAHTLFAGPVIEVPSGTIDSSNTTFTLSEEPRVLLLVLNGVIQFERAAAGPSAGWYARSTTTLTYEVAPPTGSAHRAWCWY